MRRFIRFLALGMGFAAAASPAAQAPLPAPTGRPFEIDFASDPILRLRLQQTGYERFRAAIAAAVEQHPGTAEAAAAEDEALGLLREVRSTQRPTIDTTITSYRVIARDFSNDESNIIERSRPVQRVSLPLMLVRRETA